MNKLSLVQELAQAMTRLERDKVKELVETALREKMKLDEVINEGLTAGLRRLGELFENGDAFLPELMVGASIFHENMKFLEDLIPKEELTSRGRLVIGTVEGDIHDVGKNIVASVCSAAGYEVIDLGVNVHSNVFLDAVKDYNPQILGLSALLTTTMTKQKEIIDILTASGLRENVKVIVGGAPTSEAWALQIKADAFAQDAFSAVLQADRLLGLADYTK